MTDQAWHFCNARTDVGSPCPEPVREEGERCARHQPGPDGVDSEALRVKAHHAIVTTAELMRTTLATSEFVQTLGSLFQLHPMFQLARTPPFYTTTLDPQSGEESASALLSELVPRLQHMDETTLRELLQVLHVIEQHAARNGAQVKKPSIQFQPKFLGD